MHTRHPTGDEGGVVGAHGGVCFTWRVGGGENVIPKDLHGQPQMGLQPPPPPPPDKKDLAILGDLLLPKDPQNGLERHDSGGVKVGGVWQHVEILFVGGPLREHGSLHVLTSGGRETMVVVSADHDKNLLLVKEDLFPPLHLGLPKGHCRLNAKAGLGGEGHKGGKGVRL